MNDAAVAPPGVTPIQQPTTVLRTSVIQYRGISFQVCSTTFRLMRPFLPSHLRPSSMLTRMSPMPNRPITTTRKSTPRNSSDQPNVMRRLPLMVSMPMAASPNPTIMEIMVLKGVFLSVPTKLQKVSRNTAKNSGGPNRRANLDTSGARKVISSTPDRAPKNDPVNDAVSALPARPCCASGEPLKVVATDDVSAGMLNRIEVMAAANNDPQ